MGVLMDDRITEIREALAAYDLLDKRGMNVEPPPQELVMREAARAYVDLLESDALIIRRDLAGRWPDWVLDVSPGDEQWTLELLDALASSQGVEP